MMIPVVIGANYGDEGKGLMTSYFVKQAFAKGATKVCNVRFNGGAQAGHTVVKGSQRHVFGHIGAGTMEGAFTYLASPFIINATIFNREFNELTAMGYTPEVWCHPECQVTTPYDVAINWFAELSRGSGKHGSCGMGINETVVRKAAGFSLPVGRLLSNSQFSRQMLQKIRDEWVPARLKSLGLNIEDLSHQDTNILAILQLDADTVMTVMQEKLLELKVIRTMRELKSMSDGSVVFEGAQGLCLDEDMGWFPYVTRSKTGVFNAVEVAAKELLIDELLTPVYTSRVYATRHGAGPLLHEGESINVLMHDATNVPNQWQDAIRCAPLDLAHQHDLITLDLKRSGRCNPPQFALTCLDQLTSDALFYNTEQAPVLIARDRVLDFYATTMRTVGTLTYASYGASTNDVIST